MLRAILHCPQLSYTFHLLCPAFEYLHRPHRRSDSPPNSSPPGDILPEDYPGGANCHQYFFPCEVPKKAASKSPIVISTQSVEAADFSIRIHQIKTLPVSRPVVSISFVCLRDFSILRFDVRGVPICSCEDGSLQELHPHPSSASPAAEGTAWFRLSANLSIFDDAPFLTILPIMGVRDLLLVGSSFQSILYVIMQARLAVCCDGCSDRDQFLYPIVEFHGIISFPSY